MFSNIARTKLVAVSTAKSFSTTTQVNRKVAVLGASGGIGQPLCLLLKNSPYVTELAMYDILHSPGVAADLSHIATPCKVKGYGPGQLRDALNGADVVIVSAGIARKPGQTRHDQFIVNSRIVKDLATTCAQALPNAIYGIISNPINSTVPLFSEVFRKAGVLNEKKIMGITNLNVTRTCTFIAQEKKMSDPSTLNCPVIGGHSGVTIVPVLSQCQPKVDLPTERHKILVNRVREAGTNVVQAKVGSGTVTLSMAWSGAKFTEALLQAMKGKDNIIQCAYVRSDLTKAKYFSNPLLLGLNGVEKNLGIGELSPYENELLNEAIPVLIKYIEDGENFASKNI